MFTLNNKSQTDDGKNAAEKTAEIERPLFSTKIRLSLISIIIISSLVAIFFTGSDMLGVIQNQAINTASRLSGAKGNALEAQKAKHPLPPVHPVHFFPKRLEGYEVFGRQKVPGEKEYAAEAIFKSEAEQYSLGAPISVYAKITHYGSNDAVQKVIDQDLSARGAQDRVNIDIGDVAVSAGYTKDQGTLYIEWGWSGYAFQISASYIDAIPSEGKSMLEKNAVTVGNAIWSNKTSSSE